MFFVPHSVALSIMHRVPLAFFLEALAAFVFCTITFIEDLRGATQRWRIIGRVGVGLYLISLAIAIPKIYVT